MSHGMTLSRRGAAGGLLAGLLAGCATAPPREPLLSINLVQSRPEPDASTQLETAFDEALRMTVPVYLGRQGPFQFVVDTGANSTVVGVETADRCHLVSAGTAPVHGIAGVQPAPLVKVPHLRVGQVQSRGLSLPTLSKDSLGADGLLGIDVLRDRRVRLGFRDNTFEVGQSGGGAVVARGSGSRVARPGEPVTVPARYRSGQLVIFDADVAGVPVRAFLDSGSQVTCGNETLRDLLIARQPDVARRMMKTELLSATGQTSQAVLADLPRLRLGGVALNNVRAAFAPLHIFKLWDLDDQPAILVGVDVLRYFDDVTLDFGRREVIFSRPHRSSPG